MTKTGTRATPGRNFQNFYIHRSLSSRTHEPCHLPVLLGISVGVTDRQATGGRSSALHRPSAERNICNLTPELFDIHHLTQREDRNGYAYFQNSLTYQGHFFTALVNSGGHHPECLGLANEHRDSRSLRRSLGRFRGPTRKQMPHHR